MDKQIAEAFVGKEVKIYPGDSESKFGIVKAVNEHGVMFEITQGDRSGQYQVGKLHYIAFSARLNFREA